MIASFRLDYRPPVGPWAEAKGSLLLEWQPLANRYAGTWTEATDWYVLHFFRDLITNEWYGIGSWTVDGNPNWGRYPTLTLPPAPMPAYYVAVLAIPRPNWLVRLLVTG